MEVKVKLRNIRTSPRKIRPVLPIIKGKSANTALDILKFTNKGCAKDIYQLVKSGIAAALEHEMNKEQLVIARVQCDQAQTLKRHRFKARGRVTKIRKRSSHITLVISDTFVNSNETKKELKAETIDKKIEPIKNT